VSGPIDAREFRRRLDETLRRRDPEALRDFLLASGQWEEGNTPADLPRAMWMMIAASTALADLHAEAERWLVAHGHEEEARAILRRGGAGGPSRPGGQGQRGGRRGNPRGGGDTPGGGSGKHGDKRAGGQPGSVHRPAGQTPGRPSGGAPRPSGPGGRSGDTRNGHRPPTNGHRDDRRRDDPPQQP
jgi:hypothetical protein